MQRVGASAYLRAFHVRCALLLGRRDKIVAELAEGDASGLGGAGTIDLAARTTALRELQNLRAEAVTGGELRDEVSNHPVDQINQAVDQPTTRKPQKAVGVSNNLATTS